MVRTDAQSTADLMSFLLTPLAKAFEAVAALMDPGEAEMPASERTGANHWRKDMLEAAPWGATVVTKNDHEEQTGAVLSMYDRVWATGQRVSSGAVTKRIRGE